MSENTFNLPPLRYNSTNIKERRKLNIPPLKFFKLGTILESDDVDELLSQMDGKWVYDNNYHGFQIKRHQIFDKKYYEVFKDLDTGEEITETRRIGGIRVKSI